jgi:CRP/FNR family transcriptional regulator
MTGANGREIVLYRVRPGDVCLQTLACLVDGQRYRAEGIAESDLEGTMIPRSAFPDLLSSDGEFRLDLLGAISRRFSEFERLVEDVALVGYEARLARALIRLADENGALVTTHQNLAAETATGRAAVSRTLGAFADEGLVALSRGRVDLLDREGLERIAAEEM